MHGYSEILIILGIAGLTVPFLHRLHVSPVLGYLLCGLLIAPNGLASWLGFTGDRFTIEPEAISHLAELGVVFLMFMIGLKLSINDLWRMRRHVLGLGGCQLLGTGAVIFCFARYFGNSAEVALLMAACFALSSTAVVMQLLEEKHMSGSTVGKLCFSILLMQDLAVLPILAMLAAFTAGSGESLSYLLARSLLMALVAILAIYAIGTRVLRPLLDYLNPHNKREWLMSFVLFIVIGAAILTEKAGLSAALGAFMAGLLLAETPHKKDIAEVIAPVKSLLMGVFFLSVGLMIDLRFVIDHSFWLFASVIGIGMLKAALLFGLSLGFRIKPSTAAEASIMLGQSGEFVFVILTLAAASKLIPQPSAQFLAANRVDGGMRRA
ncbi:MAG: cation:proton antiporter, partial [Alphaproteobacteria bacterium]